MNHIQIIGVRPIADVELREMYRNLHRVCPKCWEHPVEVTTLGIVVSPDMKDDNQCWCSCGWSGIVDDLMPEPPKEFKKA